MSKYVLVEGQWWYQFKNGTRTRADVKQCEHCGKDYPSHMPLSKFCSRECSGFASGHARPKGEDHHAWKGGTVTDRNGYVYEHKSLLRAYDPVTGKSKTGFFLEDGVMWYYFGQGEHNNRTRAIDKTCIVCGEQFWAREKRNQCCSNKCAGVARGCGPAGYKKGEEHPNWNGGERWNERGYVEVYVGAIPGTTRKYKRRNRLVMEEKLGRELLSTETVHHINGDRSDDRPENLELWTTDHPYGVRVSDLEIAPEFTI